MKSHRGQLIIILACLVVYSCTIFEKNFDNPVDFEANEEKGIGAPTLVFYPKTQTKTTSDSVIVGSFIVFKMILWNLFLVSISKLYSLIPI